MNQLSNILDMLHDEVSRTNSRPKGQACKHCGCHLAVVKEEPTIVHVRDWTQERVQCKILYNGKYFCQMCHRYQSCD